MRVCRELTIGGIVQGVGFRPWAAREAQARALGGRIRNTRAGVVVRLEGAPAAVQGWIAALEAHPPRGARITSLRIRPLVCRDQHDFRIEPSAAGSRRAATQLPPDAGLCADCRDELFDPAGRRHRYPFTHCAECGPRASILTALPFDRARTTLASFPPCPCCRAEYADPQDRRFHAETIACPACGPTLQATPTACGPAPGPEADPIERAAAVLRAGGIVALKGFGAYHLVVDATCARAVSRLRARKGRPSKPFALLVSELAVARRLVRLDAVDEALLAGPLRPIVVAPRRLDPDPALALAVAVTVANNVAPSTGDLGVMLPSAPAQLLLCWGPGTRPGRDPARLPGLVFTSANRSDEPALYDDDEAARVLAPIADLVVAHDRRIARPSDDSVFRTTSRGPRPIRLARGAAPKSLRLPGALVARCPVAALGGDLKSAPVLAFGRELRLLEHVGDLASIASVELLEGRLAEQERLLGLRIDCVAHDLHPGYASTQLAASLAPRTFAVAHHHAHAIACLAEHGRIGPALALVLDGGGMGSDGTLWGGELLRVDVDGFERLAQLEPIWLVGGDSAVRQPWRSAAAWLQRAFPRGAPALAWHARRGARDLERLGPLLSERRLGIETTSCGRLFDAVASLLDLCDEASHEAEAAMALESLAASAGPGPSLDRSSRVPVLGGPIPIADLIRALVVARAQGEDRGGLARAFHESLARRLVDAVAGLSAREVGLPVVLSGGCFVNRLLLDRVMSGLEQREFEVLTHRELPCSDGALAIGQAVVAVAAESRHTRPDGNRRPKST